MSSDAFNRANGALVGSTLDTGETWLAGSFGTPAGLTISSNKVKCTSGHGYNVISTGVQDGTVQVEYAGGGQWVALIVREGASGYYRIEWGNGTVYLERDVNAAALGNFAETLTAGKVISLTAETVAGPGTKLTVKVNGVTKLTYTDSGGSQRTGTRFGLGVAGDANTLLDNFVFTPIASTTTITGNQVTETDTAQAGTLTRGSRLTGTLATETDTAQTGSVTRGAALAGTQATETDTAQSGSVVSGLIIPGSLATEADSALTGAIVSGSTVAGSLATETDSALAGAVVSGLTTVVGSQALETDTALSGSLTGGIVPQEVSTDLTNGYGQRDRDGYALVVWEPNVVPTPTGAVIPSGPLARIEAHAFGPVTMAGVQPVYSVSRASKPRARQRILYNGRDITYLRGVVTPEVNYELAEPLLYGPGVLTLPQIAVAHETAGEDDLSWLVLGKPVIVQRVLDDVVVATDYKGISIAYDEGDPTALSIELGGEAQGRAALLERKPPIFKGVQDLGQIAWRSIKDLGLPFGPRLGPVTGIKSATWGGSAWSDYILEITARAWTRDGNQWTIMPNANGVYTMFRKDRTTVHFTVFTDDSRSVVNLRRDLSEEVNVAYATGVTPAGQRVQFGSYPGLKQSDPPPYPMAGDANFGEGTLDEDTLSGEGIAVMVNRLWVTGFLSLEDYPGGYDADVTRAVTALQARARTAGPVGVMTPALWDALWDLSVTLGSLNGSEILPAAQDPRTMKWLRSASGAIIRRNPLHDPHFLPVHATFEVGSGFRRGEIREFAEAEIEVTESRYGSLVLSMGAVLIGDVAVGATVTPEMLVDARSVKPGMNIRLPSKGGLLVHVVAVSYSAGIVVLTVDTKARDAMKIWEIIERNRETRRSIARLWSGNKASTEEKDSIGPWDEVGGWIDGNVDLDQGWTVVPVIAGQEGTLSDLRLVVQAIGGGGGEIIIDGKEFACAVFGKKITAARLNHLIPDPLSTEGTEAWEKRRINRALKSRDILFAAGTEEDPCGYSPNRKSRGGPITGLHTDEAGFSYKTGRARVVWLAVYCADDDATLLRGHILKNLLEAGA